MCILLKVCIHDGVIHSCFIDIKAEFTALVNQIESKWNAKSMYLRKGHPMQVPVIDRTSNNPTDHISNRCV